MKLMMKILGTIIWVKQSTTLELKCLFLLEQT